MSILSSIFVVIVLSCGLFAVGQADVSSLRYNRIGRVQSTRLQRQEVSPTPYPAAGYRPDRQFDFSAQRQPHSAQAAESQQTNFDQQQPQLIYGAPVRQPSQPSQQQQQLQILRAQQQQLEYQQRQIQQLQQLVQERQQQEQQQQQPQFTFAAPQNTYGAPEATAEASESQRQTQAKPARLTANREDVEDEEDDARSDIEADSNDAATATEGVNKPAARALPQPQPAAGTGTIAYYPAGAVTFVHPAAAAYGLSSAYRLPAASLFAKLQTQPSYYASSAAQPQLVATQQLLQPQTAAYIATPGQIQAW